MRDAAYEAKAHGALGLSRNHVIRPVDSARSFVNGVRFGRPRGLISMAELSARHPGNWRSAIDAAEAPRVSPIQHGTVPVHFADVARAMPALGVATLPRGLLFGVQGWAFTSRHELLSETSWHGGDIEIGMLPNSFGRPRELAGTCLSLASEFAADNYAHYVLDGLSRLELFMRAGGTLERVDHVFVPPPPSRSARRMLDAMGIPTEKCIWAERGSWIRADEVIVTTFPGLKRNYPDWLPASLQQYLGQSSRTATRIYVPRTGVRKAVNEAELIEVAKTFGFEVYDFETVAGEPEFFASVDAVVGAHGAALANLAFCQPGTRVLELIPSDHVHPYYYTLADSAKLDYHCLGGLSLGSRPPGSFGPSPFDFIVDPQEFRGALVAMGF